MKINKRRVAILVTALFFVVASNFSLLRHTDLEFNFYEIRKSNCLAHPNVAENSDDYCHQKAKQEAAEFAGSRLERIFNEAFIPVIFIWVSLTLLIYIFINY